MKSSRALLLGVLLLTAPAAVAAQTAPLPRMLESHGKHELLVDNAPFLILGAVGVGIEMPWAFIPSILEKLNQEKAPLLVLGSKAKVLVVFPGLLPVQVDVKEFAALQGLGDGMEALGLET